MNLVLGLLNGTTEVAQQLVTMEVLTVRATEKSTSIDGSGELPNKNPKQARAGIGT